ncbi:MAG: histidine phosphatase family protein [Anaerolineae bacterium]|jgi:probable phosphoglycerate mutase
MTNPTQIHLIRHGHVHNPQAIYYGRLPGFSLSDKGRRQAQAAARTLRDKPLAALFSSPLLRATQTAIILAQQHGLSLQITELVNEVYTPFDGQPSSELEQHGWDLYTGTEPPYEQPMDILARAQQFMTNVRQQYAGQHVAAVTHSDLIAFAILWALGQPISPKHKRKLNQNHLVPGSITTFIFQTTAQDDVPRVEFTKPGPT